MTSMNLYFRRIFRNSVRLYFAPLFGAFKGARDEVRLVLQEIERNRQTSKTTN